MYSVKNRSWFLLTGIILSSKLMTNLAEQGAKDNGDVYVVNSGKEGSHYIDDMDEVRSLCNASFSVSMDYLNQFNNTGEFPNSEDKTAPCFIRCFSEKAGLIDNWKLNAERIRKYLWPAMGDSIEVCQNEGKNETNACLRTYSIAKCLMVRAIVDGKSSPH